MTEIDVIMGMLDWNNSAEEQAAGLAQAAQVENFQVFLQPCTEHYNKNVWDNCAKALAMRSDAELDACLENLLAWLRDMNWPGAFLIFVFPLFRKHCILSCILIGSAAPHLRPPASAGRFFYRCRPHSPSGCRLRLSRDDRAQ